MVARHRVRETAKWVGSVACALIASAAVANVLWGRLTVATGPFSEIGIDGGAIITFSWDGAEDERWSFFERVRSISDWADEWAMHDGIWPSVGHDGNDRWTIIPLWIPFALVFSVTVCLWRDERKWAVVALVAFAACCVGTRVATRYFYNTYWPGHPDSFRAETALLPGLSFYQFNDYFWQDREQALIFLSACSVYAVPPIVGLALARRKVIAALILLASLAILASAIYDVWQRWDSWVRLFYGPLSRRSALVGEAWPDVAWVAGLSITGLLIGCAMYRMMARRRIPPGHCPACGYDLTGNVTGTCPECGAKAKSL